MSTALMLSSCKDFLNMPPKNVKVVYTMEDVRETMSLYLFSQVSSSQGYTGWNPVKFNGVSVQFPFTRHVNTSIQILANDLNLEDFLNNASSSYSGGKGLLPDYVGGKEWDSYVLASRIWTEVFNNIGFLNMTLKDLEKVPDFDQVNYDRISGEGRVARAYHLLQLNQLFAPSDRNDLGIPFNLDADVIEGDTRWKQTELYKVLINEIKEVMEYKTVPKTSWNLYYNHRVMCAILAQTYRYKAHTCAKEDSDWANAEYYAKEARQEERVANTLEEVTEITNIPTTNSVDKPHKFALIRFAIQASAEYSLAPWGSLTTTLFQSPSDELYKLYDDNDFRKSVYFKIADDAPVEEQDGKTTKIENDKIVNVVRLCYAHDNTDINDVHVLFSHAELLLIEAEAAAYQNNNARALELLNNFKSSRIPGYAGYKGNDIVKEIYNERRKEFAYEGISNWVDMKIFSEGLSRFAYDENAETVVRYTLQKNDFRYTLPIPEEETKYSNIPQNPGWK